MECKYCMLETANGPYRAVCAGDGDFLENSASVMLRAALSGADCIYFDEQTVHKSGAEDTDYRPDWSPDTLLSYPYTGGALLVSERLWERVGGPVSGSMSGMYDFTLRATEHAERIFHEPTPVFRRPAEPDGQIDADAVERALSRRRLNALVGPGLFADSFDVRYPVPTGVCVTVVVVAGGASCYGVRSTLESIALRNTWPHIELIIVDNDPIESHRERYFAALSQQNAALILRDPTEPDTARLCNQAAERASGSLTLFLDAGLTFRRSDAIERMTGLAIRPETGAVGAKLTSSAGKLTGNAMLWGAAGRPRSLAEGVPDGALPPLLNRYVNCIRNVTACYGAIMIKKDRLPEAGGFDNSVPRQGMLPALCIRLAQKRFRNVYTPFAVFGGAKRFSLSSMTEQERCRMDELLGPFREHGDPMFSTAQAVIERLHAFHDEETPGKKHAAHAVPARAAHDAAQP